MLAAAFLQKRFIMGIWQGFKFPLGTSLSENNIRDEWLFYEIQNKFHPEKEDLLFAAKESNDTK